MSSVNRNVPEAFIHWLWENRHWSSPLKTTQGFEVKVIDTGQHNDTDGPDFSQVIVKVNGLSWHGDLEIDWYQSHWYRHNHHKNPNYNQVIIHVVWEANPSITTCLLDGTAPFVVPLRTYVSKNIHLLMSRFNNQKVLPCIELLKMGVGIQQLEMQLKKAKKEYFFEKINHISILYDNNHKNSPKSVAWKSMTIVALFDALGIPHNRQPMTALACILLKKNWFKRPIQELIKNTLAEKNNTSNNELKWSNKGMLPYARPEFSIPKACVLAHTIYSLDMSLIDNISPMQLWDTLHIEKQYLLNKHRYKILGLTVFLPSLWILGKWCNNASLQDKAYELWEKSSISIPNSMKKVWQKTKVNPKLYSHNLACIHQYRAYCQKHKCLDCMVVDGILSSTIPQMEKE